MMKTVFQTYSPAETVALGERLTACGTIGAGDIVALRGDLGAGKTAFAKGIAQGFGIDETVLSPSYPILLQYKTEDGHHNLYHFDMYRISGEDDFLSLDFYEFVDDDSLVLIEWFENVKNYIDGNLAVITVDIRKTGEFSREIIILM